MINEVVLTGRLTIEPELKNTNSGVAYTSFQIAVDKNFTKGDEKKANFIDITAWRHNAVFVNKYFHKGNMIGIVGSLDTSTYTDDNGIKRKRVVVIAENISFCESKAKEAAAPAAGAQPNEPPADEFPDLEEIPDFDDMNSYTEHTV